MAGVKRLENRSRSTAYRGPLAVHAGLSRATLGTHDEWDADIMTGMPQWDALPFGAVVGVVDVVDCLTVDDAERLHPDQYDFASGPYCWVLADPRPLTRPVPCKGLLGLWSLPPLVRANVIAAVAETRSAPVSPR